MKKICFLNSTDAWGGGEKWHFETCHYMHKKGYQVLFLTNHNSALHKKLKTSDIPYQCLNLKNTSFLNPFKILEVKNILKKHDVDVIITNLSRDLKIGGFAAKLAGVKRVIYRRGSAIPIKNKLINRYIFNTIVTDVLANTEATKETVLQNNPKLFPKDKITVIHNYIDVAAFLNKTYNPIYSKTNNDIVLVNLGRLEHQKNQEFLINVAKELRSRQINFKLIIGGDGRLKDHLINLTKELDLEDYIKFPGFIKNPKDLIHSGDIFLLSSLWEGFGYVLAEAALCKKPVIAFNISSNPEVVVHEQTGYLTPFNDIKAFADKIEQLYKEPDKIIEMGEAGFAFASKSFNSTLIQEKIETYLTRTN